MSGAPGLRSLEKHAVWPSRKKLIIYHANWYCSIRITVHPILIARLIQVLLCPQFSGQGVWDIPIDYVSDRMRYLFPLVLLANQTLLSQVNYAFWDLRDDPTHTGFLVPTAPDAWADVDKRYTEAKDAVTPLDSWDESNPKPYYGNFGKFLNPKQHHGKLFNLGLSIAIIRCSVDPARTLARVDIDWEYIGGFGDEGNVSRPEDRHNFVEFLKELRGALNSTGRSHWEISTCTTADPDKMKALPVEAMTPNHPFFITDTINTMTYDSGDHTNLHPSRHSNLSVDRAVDAFLASGVPASKLVIGVAFYSVILPPGNFQIKKLLTEKILKSYDTVESVRAKCRYVWDKGLKVIIVWESSGDHPITHLGSLTRVLYEGLSRDPRQV
ncbi:glycoside hydrolase superfamily [Cladochytrium replicatum]|nr:glycoside hydrolase superfamily [Cladochytrium replicatum]